MKRVILAAAFIAVLSGFATAQSTSAKKATKQEKATVKKGSSVKSDTRNTVLKQEASANAKSDSTVKLLLPVPKPKDTTALPAVKKGDEF